MADSLNAQMEVAERLQTKWLEHMERLLDSGEITSTDMATLFRFFSANGWTLDPAKLPKSLRDKMTTLVDPESLDAGDFDAVVGSIG